MRQWRAASAAAKVQQQALKFVGLAEALHELFQDLFASAAFYPARRGMDETRHYGRSHGRNKGAAKAIVAQANDLDIHSNPRPGSPTFLVGSLQSHGDPGAWEPSIASDQVKAPRTNVGDRLRPGGAPGPIKGNQGGPKQTLAASSLGWWGRRRRKKPILEPG